MTGETVIGVVEQHRAPDDHVYLLVSGLAECAFDHPLSVPSLIQSLGDAAVTRVLRPDLAHAPDRCPALIQLAMPGEAVPELYLTLSADYAARDLAYNERYICGWLFSPQPLDVIATHIAARCSTAAAKDGQISPWFEPLRLELLFATMRVQAGQLLGPVRLWLLPLSWEGYTIVRGTSSSGAPGLPLDARESQQLAPVINRFLAVWRQALRQPPRFAPWRWTGSSGLPTYAAAHAFQLIRDAHRLGLRNSRDLIALSLYRVLMHPHLPQHPDIKHLIAQASAGKLDLQSHFSSSYSEAHWRRIVADLPRAKDYS